MFGHVKPDECASSGKATLVKLPINVPNGEEYAADRLPRIRMRPTASQPLSEENVALECSPVGVRIISTEEGEFSRLPACLLLELPPRGGARGLAGFYPAPRKLQEMETGARVEILHERHLVALGQPDHD